MAQVGWVFVDNRGDKNRVGLYHGDKSGHVIIHINRRIMQMDFSVKDSKSYTFFISDELIEIHLHNEGDSFSYEFKINREADTPLNRTRKIYRRRDLKKTILLMLGMGAFLFAVLYGALWYGWQQEKKKLAAWNVQTREEVREIKRLISEGRSTRVKFFVLEDADTSLVLMQYLAGTEEEAYGAVSVYRPGQILPNGFPLSDGDVFQLLYLPDNPKVYRVNFNSPSAETIQRYKSLAYNAEQKAHPGQDSTVSKCIVDKVNGEAGWNDLAHIIFQENDESENEDHNQDSYLRLIRSQKMERYLQDCR